MYVRIYLSVSSPSALLSSLISALNVQILVSFAINKTWTHLQWSLALKKTVDFCLQTFCIFFKIYIYTHTHTYLHSFMYVCMCWMMIVPYECRGNNSTQYQNIVGSDYSSCIVRMYSTDKASVADIYCNDQTMQIVLEGYKNPKAMHFFKLSCLFIHTNICIKLIQHCTQLNYECIRYNVIMEIENNTKCLLHSYLVYVHKFFYNLYKCLRDLLRKSVKLN